VPASVRQRCMKWLSCTALGVLACPVLLAACASTSAGDRPAGGAGRATGEVVTTVPVSTTTTTVPATLSRAHCRSGSLSVSASPAEGPAVCVRTGAVLIVTFDDSPGAWGGSAAGWDPDSPWVYGASVLRLASSSTAGDRMTATFDAVAPGTATVTAHFDVSCTSRNTSPCTIPPVGDVSLEVRVAPR
jgi:hypothetical protein